MSIRRLALLAGVAVLAGCTTPVADVAPSPSATDAACESFASYPRAPGTTVTFLISESIAVGDAPADDVGRVQPLHGNPHRQ